MSDQVNNNVYIKPEDLEKMRQFTSGINTLPLATLRDKFAMAALSVFVGQQYDFNSDAMAQKAYEIADAMLKARQGEDRE